MSSVQRWVSLKSTACMPRTGAVRIEYTHHQLDVVTHYTCAAYRTQHRRFRFPSWPMGRGQGRWGADTLSELQQALMDGMADRCTRAAEARNYNAYILSSCTTSSMRAVCAVRPCVSEVAALCCAACCRLSTTGDDLQLARAFMLWPRARTAGECACCRASCAS